MKFTFISVSLFLCLLLGVLSANAQAPIPIQLSTDGGANYNQNLQAVQIGEYLWLNKDIKRLGNEEAATQQQIDRILMWYQMFQHHANGDAGDSFWNYTTLSEFNDHLGTYFTKNEISDFSSNKLIYAKENGSSTEVRWKLPNNADVLQLVAMCGNGTLNEVKQFLSYSYTDQTAPNFVKGIYPDAGKNGYWWFDLFVMMGYDGYNNANIPLSAENNNKYGFNMIPNGTSRYHAPSELWTVDHSNGDAPISFTTETNDFNGLFQVASICTGPASSLSLNDVIQIAYGADFANHSLRFCRPMSDDELGYKLYINQDVADFIIPTGDVFESTRQRSGEENLLAKIRAGEINVSDIQIVKKGLGDVVPEGFQELPKGYIRGFYVQYILNKPTGQQKTIEEIFDIALYEKKIWAEPERIDRPAPSVETKKLVITYDNDETSYDVVRIGEYLWANRNIVRSMLNSFSEKQILSILSNAGVSRDQYPVDSVTFEANFGTLLSNNSSYQSVSSATEDGIQMSGWDMANIAAYDQLFGMCGRNAHGDVKNYLGAKAGDNPAALNVEGTAIGDWFAGNMNIYGFNLMPSGRKNRDSGEIENYFGVTHFKAKAEGDSYGKIICPEKVTENNDYVVGTADMHYRPSRFCRKLTNEELGYKIFINDNDLSSLSGGNHILKYLEAYNALDIKVVYDPNAIAPQGYSEMPNGRMRGFFVQFELGNYEPNAQQIGEVFGYYRITSALYGSCLSANGTNIFCSKFEANDGQHWKIEKAGQDFKILIDNSQVLTYDGTTVSVSAASSTDDQLWNIFVEGNGLYKISPKNNPTKALEIIKEKASTLSVNIYEKKGTQKWKLPHSVLYLVGDATTGGWDLSQMEKIKADPLKEDVFVWEGELSAGSLKVNPLKDSFNEALNSISDGLALYSRHAYDLILNYQMENDYKFNVRETGNYIVTIDLNDRTLKVSKRDVIPLIYSSDDLTTEYPYEGVRIGEYYWMNSNFHSPIVSPPTQDQLITIMQKKGLDPTYYDVNMDDFRRYYGEYYSRYVLESMYSNGKIYEGEGKIMKDWSLPSATAFEQLFAMCGDGSNADVRKYLGCKEGENPIAYSFIGMQWFANNTNEYGFNMTPGGARAHSSGDFGSGIGYLSYGDFYDLFDMSRFVADGAQTITIKDGHARVTEKLWHLLNMRWCRKLTTEELGYRLFINVRDYNESKDFLAGLNSSGINIIKVNLNETQRTEGSGNNTAMSIQEMVSRTKELKDVRTTTEVRDEIVGKTYVYIKGGNSIIIKSNNVDIMKNITIYTADGRLLHTTQSYDIEIEIPISEYLNGVYVISIKTAEGSIIEKFTKN